MDAVCLSRDLNAYAIRLEPEQSLALYGYFRPKKTLTWRDVLDNERITFAACVQNRIAINKLYRLQPDIKEWIRNGKSTVHDCEHMTYWRPNPFVDLGCSIGDLVLYRRVLPPILLFESGVTFRTMRDRYGLTPEIMMLLKYSADDWVRLEIEEDFIMQLSNEHWARLFGLMTRSELIAQVRRHHQQKALAARM